MSFDFLTFFWFGTITGRKSSDREFRSILWFLFRESASSFCFFFGFFFFFFCFKFFLGNSLFFFIFTFLSYEFLITFFFSSKFLNKFWIFGETTTLNECIHFFGTMAVISKSMYFLDHCHISISGPCFMLLVSLNFFIKIIDGIIF